MPRTQVVICDSTLQLVYSGTAIVGIGDKFSRKRGTALALKRALAGTGFSREERRQVYNKMFNQDKRLNKKIIQRSIIHIINSDPKLINEFASRLGITTQYLETFLKV